MGSERRSRQSPSRHRGMYKLVMCSCSTKGRASLVANKSRGRGGHRNRGGRGWYD